MVGHEYGPWSPRTSATAYPIAAMSRHPDNPGDPPPRVGPDIPRRPPIAIMDKNSLGHIMQSFKAAVSQRAVRDGLLPRGTPIWQCGV